MNAREKFKEIINEFCKEYPKINLVAAIHDGAFIDQEYFGESIKMLEAALKLADGAGNQVAHDLNKMDAIVVEYAISQSRPVEEFDAIIDAEWAARVKAAAAEETEKSAEGS